MPSSNWQRLISGHVQQATLAPSSDVNRRDKGRRSGWAGALCLSSLGIEQASRDGQAQGPHVRSTAPLVPTTIIKRGDGNEHRTSSAAWEIRVTGTPGTWWHGGGLESAGYAIATPCGYQAAAC